MASPGGKTDAVTTDDTGGNAADDAKKKAQQMNYELHMTMKYMYQRVKTFEVDASIPCEFEKYMIWHYVLGNSTLFNDKRGILKTENELDIDIETIAGDEWLIIDIGTLSTKLADPEITKTRDLIVHSILRGSDTLLIKSFSTIGVDKSNFADLMMEKIDSTHQHKSWLFTDQESDLVHCVYEKELSNFVESVSKEIFTKIEMGEKHLEQKLVFYKVLQSFKVREKVKSKYKGKVKMAIDFKESANSCGLMLQGQRSEVESAEIWIQDTYIKDFVFNELSFCEIKNVSNSHAIEHIAEEVFQEYTEVFWYVNSIRDKIGICSKTSNETDNAMAVLKKCLKKYRYPIKVKQHLEAMPEFRDGRACMEGVSDNAQEICVIATTRILQKIDEKLNTDRNGTEKHNQPTNVKVFFKVDDKADFEVIRRSLEFKPMNGVEIKEISDGGQLGFILFGPSSMCADVKEKLTQKMHENKERIKGAAKQHWDLQSNHVTVHSSCDTTVREDMDVLVDTGANGKDARREHKTDNKELGINFDLLKAQGLSRFGVKGEDVKDTEYLQTMGTSVTGNEKGSLSFCAPTKYQLDYADHILKCGNEVDEGFQYVAHECSQDVWDIVEAVKSNEIKQLQQKGVTISYTLGLADMKNVNSSADEKLIEEINSYIKYMKGMVILEIPIFVTNNEKVKNICAEVGNEKETQCVFLEKQRRVLAFDKTYEGALRIKHQILIKDGQMKITNRGKRDFPIAEYSQFDLKKQATNLKKYLTAEGMVVYVYEANILKLPVDCIVKDANETLQHSGGVGRMNAQAAGRSLDTEGFTHIKKNKKVPVGEVCVTTAGKLHYDCVIHAVGPRWSDYYPHSFSDVQLYENLLYSAITKSLDAAEDRGLESIALPAISAAIFGVPEELCVYHYAKATLDYSRKQSPKALKEVYFIDINPSIITRIQNMFTAMLRPGYMPDYRTEKFVKSRTHEQAVSKTFEKRIKTNKAMKDKSVYYMKTEKGTLLIKCGDLRETKTDAMVSTEDLNGSGKGKIAKLMSKFSVNASPCKVYVTEGFDGYKKVIHAVVPYEIRNESQEKRRDTIKEAVKNVFHQANKNSINSVVMGLLGAGKNTKEEVQVAADAFIQAYQEYFLKSNKELSITLVCRDGRAFDFVTEKLMEYELIEDDNKTPPPRRPLPSRLSHLEGLPETVESENLKSLEDCVICLEQIGADRKVLECGHAFHEGCIGQQFTHQKNRPMCGKVCGELTGDQPEGEREDRIESWNHCAGFEKYGRISITYRFPNGKQGSKHPNPGKRYKGITRTAYLPDTTEGREVLEMLKIAFDRKLTFTIGTSRATGEEGVIIWNDIHHKTDPKPYTQFGYPDPEYLDRVREELAVKGVTVEDIPKKY